MKICPTCKRTNREPDALFCCYCGQTIPSEKIEVVAFTKDRAINCVSQVSEDLILVSDRLKFVKERISRISSNLALVAEFLREEDFDSLKDSWDLVIEETEDQFKEIDDFILNTTKDLSSLKKKYKLETKKPTIDDEREFAAEYHSTFVNPTSTTTSTSTSTLKKKYSKKYPKKTYSGHIIDDDYPF